MWGANQWQAATATIAMLVVIIVLAMNMAALRNYIVEV
jgi:hypothetical protein